MIRPKRVVLESPWAGDVEKNRLYALCCLRDMFNRNEAPMASHLLYPPALDAFTPEARERGMQSGWVWTEVAELVAVYTDRGITEGMIRGIARAESLDIPVERRTCRWP